MNTNTDTFNVHFNFTFCFTFDFENNAFCTESLNSEFIPKVGGNLLNTMGGIFTDFNFKTRQKKKHPNYLETSRSTPQCSSEPLRQ